MQQSDLKKVIKKIVINKNNLPTIAVSGGIDSITLATFVSSIFQKYKINVSHAIGPAVPIEATNRVKDLAKKYNWKLNIINTQEISDPRYSENPINRCYFCKENLYKTIKLYTKGSIFSGANLDDLKDYRPGLDAAKDANVEHPFILAKFRKKNIRKLAYELGLGQLSVLPSSPCLASRVETGIKITPSLLDKIDNIERYIKNIFIDADIRCRWMIKNLDIQFNHPELDSVTEYQKKLIRKKANEIFSLKDTNIIFSEYKKGSAFIPRNTNVQK